MSKVTYIFGAGASKNALPLINEIPSRTEQLVQTLEQDNLALDNKKFSVLKEEKTKRNFQLELISDLKWLSKTISNHSSVDTFAKKLYITKNFSDYYRLKLALSVFFVFEQARNKPDIRYDLFFASILSSTSVLPSNIRILTWNYDYQFELTFSNYINQYDLKSLEDYLSVDSKFFEKPYSQGFRIFKLNGTIGLFRDGFNNYRFINKINRQFDLGMIHEVIQNYATIKSLHDLKISLSFSWEPESNQTKLIDRVIQDISNTEVLIVIGYSVHFFNREIDRAILNNMKNLKRIYIQSPEADGVKERLLASMVQTSGIEIINKYNTEQFYLPNEL